MHIASVVVVIHKTIHKKGLADNTFEVAVLLVDRPDLSLKAYVLNSDDLYNLHAAMVIHLFCVQSNPEDIDSRRAKVQPAVQNCLCHLSG